MIIVLLLISVSKENKQQLLLLKVFSAYAQGFVFPGEKPTISVVGEAKKKYLQMKPRYRSQ